MAQLERLTHAKNEIFNDDYRDSQLPEQFIFVSYRSITITASKCGRTLQRDHDRFN